MKEEMYIAMRGDRSIIGIFHTLEEAQECADVVLVEFRTFGLFDQRPTAEWVLCDEDNWVEILY